MSATEPQWEASALVVVAMQRDFLDDSSPLLVQGTADIVPRLARLIGAFRTAARPVAHAIRLFTGDDVELSRRRMRDEQPSLLAPGGAGSAVAGELLPSDSTVVDASALLRGELQRVGPHEAVLFAPRWSAFYRTALDEHLRAMGVSTVVVAGCNLPVCPRATLFGAGARDYRTVLVPDVTSQVTHERLADVRLIGTQVHASTDVIAALTPASPSPSA